MGTQAALDNPRCRHDDPAYGPYGRFDTTLVGGGADVREGVEGGRRQRWRDRAGRDEGPDQGRLRTPANDQQLTDDPVKPIDRSTGTTGTYRDGVYDYLLPELRFYETWGRDIEAHFVTSTGSDEQAQRADLVAITAMKPFAVMNLISGTDLEVLEAGLATAKIMSWGYDGVVRGLGQAVAVPVGFGGQQRDRDQLGRGDRQATRRQEGRVRR